MWRVWWRVSGTELHETNGTSQKDLSISFRSLSRNGCYAPFSSWRLQFDVCKESGWQTSGSQPSPTQWAAFLDFSLFELHCDGCIAVECFSPRERFRAFNSLVRCLARRCSHWFWICAVDTKGLQYWLACLRNDCSLFSKAIFLLSSFLLWGFCKANSVLPDSSCSDLY